MASVAIPTMDVSHHYMPSLTLRACTTPLSILGRAYRWPDHAAIVWVQIWTQGPDACDAQAQLVAISSESSAHVTLAGRRFTNGLP